MNTTFLYLQLGQGTATVAIVPLADNTVEVGVAFCSPEDQFSRAEGRKRALERITQKKDFYVHYERNTDSLKGQAKSLVKLIVSGRWVSVLDFATELDTIIYEIITETSKEIEFDLAPMTVHTNTIPVWARHAVIEKNFY